MTPVGCSPPSSSVYGTLQARILEWVAISFSRGSSQPRVRTQVSYIAGRLFNLWATREAQYIVLLDYYRVYGIPRPEYWSGQPFPFPGDLPNPGIKPRSSALQVDFLPTKPQGKLKNTGGDSLSPLQGIFWNQTGVSCITGRFFTNWAVREAHI